MDPALRLLLWLRFRGWLRRLGRLLSTVKGILLAVFGFCLFGFCLFFGVILPMLVPEARPQVDPEAVRRYGTLGLLAYCVSILVFSTGERAISFTPAEVNFLFPGPFSRRQLLVYKIVVTLLNAGVGTLVFAVFCKSYAPIFLAGYLGMLLAILFLQLFAMAVAFVGSTAGVLAYNRGRKLVLGLLAVLIGVALLQLGKGMPGSDWRGVLERWDESPLLSVLLAPLSWFANAFTARRLWPDLAQWAGLGLLVDGVLLGLVFALDAHYLETAASASERLYARMQRLRSGGVSAQWGGAGRVRFTLPNFPWWGGLGPSVWRQLLTTLRSLKGMLLFLLIVGVSATWPMLLRGGGLPANEPGVGVGLASGLLTMTLFLFPMLLTFDFRGDLDRMEVLKSLPLPPVTLVLGQLTAPVLLGSLIQLILLTALQALVGGVGEVLLAAVLFVLPFNFLLFGLENLVFLHYPTRMAPATAGDFQMVGRNMLLLWGKFLALALVLGMIALAATVAYFVAGRSWPAALACAWLLLAGVDVALVPLLVVAFGKFDVARDTPA